MVGRIVQIVLAGLDRRRFPWIAERREPTEAERSAAVLASAALMAMRKLETSRRSDEKGKQEEQVEAALLQYGFVKVATCVETLALAPERCEFCGNVCGVTKDDLSLAWGSRMMTMKVR